DRHILGAVNRDTIAFAALDALNGAPSFLLRGMIGWWGGRGVGFDQGLALLALEVVELVPQPLVLGLRGAQVGGLGFDEIQQPDDQFAGAFVGDAAEIEVVEHGAFLITCRAVPHYTRSLRMWCGRVAPRLPRS